MLLQIVAVYLLQNGAGVITNWSSYCKLGQPLLQIGATITNWRKLYDKLGQLLQIEAIITNRSITNTSQNKLVFYEIIVYRISVR